MSLLQVDKSYIHDMADLAKYGIGSLISGGSGQPFDNSPLGFAEMVRTAETAPGPASVLLILAAFCADDAGG